MWHLQTTSSHIHQSLKYACAIFLLPLQRIEVLGKKWLVLCLAVEVRNRSMYVYFSTKRIHKTYNNPIAIDNSLFEIRNRRQSKILSLLLPIEVDGEGLNSMSFPLKYMTTAYRPIRSKDWKQRKESLQKCEIVVCRKVNFLRQQNPLRQKACSTVYLWLFKHIFSSNDTYGDV